VCWTHSDFSKLQLNQNIGYDQGVLSSVVSNTDFLNVIDNPNDVRLGALVASYNLGSFTGAILTFIFAEKLGRRWCMWAAMAWITVSAKFLVFGMRIDNIRLEQYYKHQRIARHTLLLDESFAGSELALIPLLLPCKWLIRTTMLVRPNFQRYQAELSHAKSRGRLVSSELLFVGVGIVIAYWFNYGMQTVGGPIAWRLVIAFQIVFAIVSKSIESVVRLD
jgi:MFS family permease